MLSKCVFLCSSSFVFFFLTSCNHLFYHPDNYPYADPAHGNVKYNNLLWENSEKMKLQVLDLLPAESEIGSIVHLHGNAQNRSSHFLYSYWLTDYGYRVYVPDYRGYGGSEGKASRVGLVDDSRFFIKEACESTKKPVFVFGQSLGGALAIPALEHESSCVCALIVESSFSSYRRIARQKLASFWLSWFFQYPLSFLVSDNESPIDYVQNVKIPTLFIHGTEDKIVPIAFGKELYERSGSSEKEFWTVEGAHHTPAFGDDQSPYRTKLVEWLKKQSSRCKK